MSFTENGARIFFDGIELEAEGDALSRFYPLYEMAQGINTQVTRDSVKHLNGYIFK